MQISQMDSLVLQIPERLSDIAEGLKGTCQGVEQEFLHLGDALQQTYAGAEELTRLTRNAVANIGGKTENGLLQEIKNLVHQTLQSIETYGSVISRNLEHVGIIVDRLGSLELICAEIEKIGRFLKVVGVNMGVECARSDAAKQMFGTVFVEIKDVSRNVLDVVANIRDAAKSARDSQNRAYHDSSEGLNTLASLSGEAQRNVGEAITGIDRLMRLSASILEQAGAHSRTISNRIGEIVVGIQFQDNMRQRAEHIADTLMDIGKLLGDESDDAETGMTLDEKRAYAYRIIELQTAQLKEILIEINEVHQKSKQGFDGIAGEVLKLEVNFSEFGSTYSEMPMDMRTHHRSGENIESTTYRSGGDPFAILNNALKHLNGLLKKGHTLIDRLSKTAHQASETAANLSGHAAHVRDISLTTHILALNAIINATKLGKEGRTFDVLAQEVSGLSRQTNNCMKDATKLLELITDSVGNLDAQDIVGDHDGSGEVPVNIALSEGIDKIYNAYHLFGESAKEAFQRSGGIKQTLSETQAGLGFFLELDAELNGYLEKMLAVSHLLDSWKDKGRQLAKEKVDTLLQQYTMEKERQILDLALGGEAAEGTDGPLSELQAGKEDVELFESFTDDAETPGNGDGGAADDIELFDAVAGPAENEGKSAAMPDNETGSPAGENKDEEDDLGDNFELF